MEIFLDVPASLLAGMFLNTRYLRQRIAANIALRLEQIQQQLRTVETEVHLDSTTRRESLTSALTKVVPHTT